MYKSNSYGDSLAQKKRRRFFIRLSLALSVLFSLCGLAIYAMFYSGWLDITSITITGFKTVNENQLSEIVNSAVNDKLVPILGTRYGKNTYLFDPEPVKEDILAQFTVIKEVKIEKKYPHNINVEISERVPVGTWCFGDDCSYFDESGALWGKAIKSSGSLLLTIEDNRTPSGQKDEINGVLLKNIQNTTAGLESLNIKTTRVEIRPDSINDFYVHTTSGYYLMFSEEMPIDKQLGILKIFLDEKGRDFKAEYVDLRIEGRVYFK